MGAEIDRLEVQVEAEASKANSSLDKLVGKLERIQSALAGVNSRGMATMGAGINKVANAMNNLNANTNSRDFSVFASNLEKLNSVNTSNFANLSGSMKTLSSGLREISAVNFDASGINSIAVSLNKLGGIKATAGTQNLLTIKDDLAKFVIGMNSIGSLTFDVSSLSALLDSVSKLGGKTSTQAATNLAPISAQLQNLVRQLNNIGSLTFDTTNLSNLITAISKLGGASVQRAITNLPQLATAINNLMTTLSKAPAVSNNILQMIDALANLTSQGAKVGTAGNSLVSSLNRVGNSMSTTTKKALSLSSAIGKLYQRYFLLIRGAKKLWTSIESSMDYVEVLNYFDAAFGQVAEKAVSQWSEAGDSSAEEYYNSFASRAKELTSKMTGYTVNDDGTLTSTGSASLGINPSELMNYQAMFAQMSSSMGVASETSLKLSQALTEIGADLASVKNLDFDDVWQDMASGLAGMSRTLDKYGVNIRNVNMQQKLTELGIEENITALNQQDKALLRAIILLENTKYAWGDLSDTLNQPANQLRLLNSNFSNLSRTIGNLFLPVVSKVLPYINGLVIALQRLFTWVGNLLGIDLSNITSSVGSSDFDWGSLIDDTDDLTDSLDSASEAADKLKKGIRAFDELNVITTKDDSDSSSDALSGLSSGLLDAAFDDAFSKYQAAWDEAFAGIENKAQEFADKIEEFLQPLKDIIEDFAIGDFFKAGQDTSELVSGIFNFFADAIDKVDWSGIGGKIGDFLAGLDWYSIITSYLKLKFNIWKAIAEAWFGAFDAAPVETAILTGLGLLKFTKLGKWAMAFAKNKLLKSVTSAWSSLGGLSGIFNTDLKTIVSSGTALEAGIAIGTKLLAGVAAGVAEFATVSNSLERMIDGTESVIAGISKITAVSALAGTAMYAAFGPAGVAFIALTGIVAAVKGINDGFEKLTEELVNESVFDGYGIAISDVADKVSELINATGTSSDTMQTFSNDISEIKDRMEEAAGQVEDYRSKLETTGNLSEEEISEMKNSVDELADSLKDNLQYNADIAFDTFMSMSEETAEQLGIDVGTMTEILSQFQNRFNGIYDDMQSEADGLMDKMLLGTATDEDISQLYGLLDDLEYLSIDAIQRQIDLQNTMNDMMDIDFSSVDKTTKAIEQIKDTGLEKMTELDEYYGELENQVAVWNEEVKRAFEIGKISEEEAASYYDWTSALTSTYDNNWESEKTEIENQINTAYEYILAQLEKAGTEACEKAENEDQGIWGAVFNPHAVTKAADEFTEDMYTPIVNAINDAKAKINPEAESIGTEFWDNYSNGIKEAELSTGDMYDTAWNLVEGFKKGIDENAQNATDAVIEMMNGVIEDGAEKTLDEHSPSKVFEGIGEYCVEGFNEGITNNEKTSITLIEKYSNNIVNKFTELVGKFETIGINVMNGMLDGMSSMENTLYAKAEEIADNIAKTVQNALDIHSPSRVMYGLGEFTMEGFQLGMENLYANIESSLQSFGSDLQYEIAPVPQPAYAGAYGSDTFASIIPASEYNNYAYYNNQSNYDATETNMLLRELLSAVKAGQTIEINGKELGKTVRKEDAEYYNRTGKGMFQH